VKDQAQPWVDPEIARLGGESLAGRLVNLYKGIVVRKHITQAAEDHTIELWATLETYTSHEVRMVEISFYE
jgi:hypothetical protein